MTSSSVGATADIASTGSRVRLDDELPAAIVSRSITEVDRAASDSKPKIRPLAIDPYPTATPITVSAGNSCRSVAIGDDGRTTSTSSFPTSAVVLVFDAAATSCTGGDPLLSGSSLNVSDNRSTPAEDRAARNNGRVVIAGVESPSLPAATASRPSTSAGALLAVDRLPSKSSFNFFVDADPSSSSRHSPSPTDRARRSDQTTPSCAIHVASECRHRPESPSTDNRLVECAAPDDDDVESAPAPLDAELKSFRFPTTDRTPRGTGSSRPRCRSLVDVTDLNESASGGRTISGVVGGGRRRLHLDDRQSTVTTRV